MDMEVTMGMGMARIMDMDMVGGMGTDASTLMSTTTS